MAMLGLYRLNKIMTCMLPIMFKHTGIQWLLMDHVGKQTELLTELHSIFYHLRLVVRPMTMHLIVEEGDDHQQHVQENVLMASL